MEPVKTHELTEAIEQNEGYLDIKTMELELFGRMKDSLESRLYYLDVVTKYLANQIFRKRNYVANDR